MQRRQKNTAFGALAFVFWAIAFSFAIIQFR